jgi:hypothetical protein
LISQSRGLGDVYKRQLYEYVESKGGPQGFGGPSILRRHFGFRNGFATRSYIRIMAGGGNTWS